MSHTSGKIRKSQRLGLRAFKQLQHLKAAQLRQDHLSTVILRTHPHRRKDLQVHHRNLSLDMQVNLYRPMKPVTPMTTRIQTRAYMAPSSSALIRCVFLVDTRRTRTRSTRITVALFWFSYRSQVFFCRRSNVQVQFCSDIRGVRALSLPIYLTHSAYQANQLYYKMLT